MTMNRTQDQDIDESRKGIATGTEDSPNRELDAAIAELDSATRKLPEKAIKWIRKDVPPVVPANGNVIDGTFILNSQRSGHSVRLRN